MISSIRDFLFYWAAVFKAAGKNWLDSQAFIYAAALAFFTVFSIAPVVILIVAVVGLLLGEDAARAELMGQLEMALGPQAMAAVETAIENSRVQDSGIWPTLAGLGATILGATTVFAQMQKSLNQIWDVAPRPSRNSIWLFVKARLLSLTMVLSIGFILLVSLLLGVAVTRYSGHGGASPTSSRKQPTFKNPVAETYAEGPAAMGDDEVDETAAEAEA